MKPAQPYTTADMLLKLDPVGDFDLYQDCLPPMLRLQANLFGERIPTEAEEAAALDTFRTLYGMARNGFDRRKTDRRLDPARLARAANYQRRKGDDRNNGI
ncbi:MULTISPECIES: hypothetical protein [Undibacterium]|uniref:Uncharacterized protein n=1 Tax=Undibacterium umbellatum TaxID=2762300 RepID=A0ABR6Z970_9BURK|nr:MULTISPECIES: hypothetical protein [Undibacterium]MBC3908310.1 hypothetical protein [Undibacterium umbellatum]MDP1976074.1 hypothetical protein [Undibacterium sp.]